VQGCVQGRPGVEQRKQAGDTQGAVHGGVAGADEDQPNVLHAAAPTQLLQGVQRRAAQQGDPAEVNQDPGETEFAKFLVPRVSQLRGGCGAGQGVVV
jgi:hypothetical protein